MSTYMWSAGDQQTLMVRSVRRWGEDNFMSMLLRELDRGPAALPRGFQYLKKHHYYQFPLYICSTLMINLIDHECSS